MKIGILGGSFNPPHIGHKNLALKVRDALSLDKVIILPSCIPPHKGAGALADKADRLEMCRIAFSEPVFEISSLEIDRGNKSYTVETLREFKKIYPEDDLYFIIGSDMLDTFRQWYLWDEILTLCTLCACSRQKGYVPDLSGFSDAQRKKTVYIDIEPVEISSTVLRAKLRSNLDCSDMLDPGVINYIKSHHLYDDGFDSYRELLGKMLDPVRLYHCECVSESAGELAKRYGADEEKAKLAGLLHDITKRMPEDEQRELIGPMTDLESKNHKVWHQMSAPVFLKSNGIVTDEEILGSIRYHTTGKADMTLLEKIVYTADFISADRDYPDVETVRALARISLEHAMLYTSRYTINSLVQADRPVHPSTLECYNDTLKHFGL